MRSINGLVPHSDEPADLELPQADEVCADALDDAQARLARETLRNERLQRELVLSQAALGRAQAELTGARANERHALHQANHDGLTALPNRGAFMTRLNAAIDDETDGTVGLALLFIDLDQFKQVNDSYGHQVGDELLRIVASRLMQAVRGRDAVGRLGGDEFCCLLMDAPSRLKVSRVASKLHAVIAAPTQLGPALLSIRPSIGIALSRPGDGLTAEQLMQHADSAMYLAKRQQCKFVFFQQGDEGSSDHQMPITSG